MGGSGHRLKVISSHLAGWTEENDENPQSGDEILTRELRCVYV